MQVTLSSIPATLAEFENLPRHSPEEVCAGFLCALALYTKDPAAGTAAMDLLRGPRPMTPYDAQFLRDRLRGKEYLPLAYFEGAAPENSYTPAKPYVLNVLPDPRPQDKVTCTGCDFELTASHNWGGLSKTDATFDAPGAYNYKCSVCPATKSEPIAKLEKIGVAAVTVTAPVRGAAPESAAKDSAETAYGVADTDWYPGVSGTFAGGTVYTVKVYLEATGSNRFTDQTVFTINGQTATVVPGTEPTAAGTEYVILTYEFPATDSGSSSSGIGSTAYTVTVLDSKNGSVAADRKTASAGSTVTLTVTPDKGCTLETLSVLDRSGKEIKLTEKDGKYTFTMPASNVEVKATFMDDNTMLNFFADVKASDYFYDAVLWAAEKGITGGTDAAHFTPNGVCTRAQAVTFLWRAAGSPAPKSKAMPFTDVPAGSYYEQAVLWAVENGITNGTSATTFSPDLTCSRAQIVAFLWRSQKSPAAGSVNPFTDVSADAYYADAVLWAVKENVTSGTTAATFSPNADCTRAQIVTFIYRALAK